MGSLFKPSAETGKNLHDKILIFGPTHTSKTYAALTWEGPVAQVDVENRAAHFADRFEFLHARPRTMEEVNAVLEELRTGALPCNTIVLDSYSAIYEKLIVSHTVSEVVNGKRITSTDYAVINKRIAPVREFIFSTFERNLIVTAHIQQKYDRNGKVFTARRDLEFFGDAKFRYAFDYIFRTEPTGPDPRVHAIKFIVEKSASPNLKIGDVLVVKPNERLYEIFRSRVSRAAETPGQRHASPVSAAAPAKEPAVPISMEQVDRIEVLERRLGLGQMKLADFVKRITNGGTPHYRKMTGAEADRLITVLDQRAKGAA